MSQVLGRHSEIVGQSRGGDLEVVGSDDLAASLKVSPELSVGSRNFKGEGEDGHSLENGLHESLAPTSTQGAVGAMKAVEELRSRNSCDRALLISELVQESARRFSRSLDRDENAGVDQESQGEEPMGGCEA